MTRGIPTTGELVAAAEDLVAECLQADRSPSAYELRLVRRVLQIAGRTLANDRTGAGTIQACAAAAMGAADDAGLAALIRSGALDGRRGELIAALRADTIAQLARDNPGYPTASDRPPAAH